jgi:hypothetical protein
MALVVAGCVISDPPTYGVTKQSPPFLDATSAVPGVFGRLDVSPGDVVKFNVRVRSEDVGTALDARLWLDYKIEDANKIPKQVLLQTKDIPPSTFDDDKRFIEIPWNSTVATGCHAVSLVVTHKTNLNELNEPVLPEDTAILTWWVNYADSDLEPNTLVDCPKYGGAT